MTDLTLILTVALAAAFVLVARLQSVPALLAAVALLGVSDSFGQPLQNGYFTDLEEVHHYGYDRALGVYSLISNAAQSLGSFVFSYVLIIGVSAGLIVASAALAGLALLFLLFSGQTREAVYGYRTASVNERFNTLAPTPESAQNGGES